MSIGLPLNAELAFDGAVRAVDSWANLPVLPVPGDAAQPPAAPQTGSDDWPRQAEIAADAVLLGGGSRVAGVASKRSPSARSSRIRLLPWVTRSLTASAWLASSICARKAPPSWIGSDTPVPAAAKHGNR